MVRDDNIKSQSFADLSIFDFQRFPVKIDPLFSIAHYFFLSIGNNGHLTRKLN